MLFNIDLIIVDSPIQQIATVATYVTGFGQIIWIWNVVRSILTGADVETIDVWDLKRDNMFTRE